MPKIICTKTEMGFTSGKIYEIVRRDAFNGIVVVNDAGHACCMAPSYVDELFEEAEDGCD